MALECSYCGARTTDDATRCPQCLRATGLIAAPESTQSPPFSAKKKALIAVGLVALGAAITGGVALAKRARAQSAVAVQQGTASSISDVPAPFARVEALSALVRAARSGDALAKGRAVHEAIRTRMRDRQLQLVTSVDGVPPARTLEAIAAALETAGARVTSLDLCRALYSALDEAGAQPRFARRASGSRPDVPADPSGVLGRYVVLVGEHAIDPIDSLVIAKADARPSEMTAAQVTGAMLVQSAIASMTSGDRARASTLLARAVELYPEAGIVHAARATVTRSGLSGGVDDSVVRDLATAVVASGDDPAINILRARAALVHGDIELVRTSARAARNRARGWGDAALAQVLAFDPANAQGAGRCDPLIDARETWTDDALTACRALTAEGAAPPESTAAAQRLARTERDPMRLALVAAALGEVVHLTDGRADEYARWLALAGRNDLARAALGDAGP
ncbi:MAG: hypothetical protein JNK05_39230 [Myxococcales bacterium]|nr:hypothetical protein [Myxococcales bacterium]